MVLLELLGTFFKDTKVVHLLKDRLNVIRARPPIPYKSIHLQMSCAKLYLKMSALQNVIEQSKMLELSLLQLSVVITCNHGA